MEGVALRGAAKQVYQQVHPMWHSLLIPRQVLFSGATYNNKSMVQVAWQRFHK